TRFCETCAKPLDVVEAELMKSKAKEETQAMVYEIMRQDKSKKKKNKRGEALQEQLLSQQEEIQSLKDMITKMSKAE
ncbi:MAG: hypothetical protein HOB51_00850, partial [Thaumarchaeota archaeon]|nr:hypothetical protein [Nitrososphaerota archaeon]